MPSTSTNSVTTLTAAPRPALTVRLFVLFMCGGVDPFYSDTLSPVNPFSKKHGAPSDAERHVGDLGNFKTDAQGNATGSMQDKLVKLIGAESVLGVSLIVASLISKNLAN